MGTSNPALDKLKQFVLDAGSQDAAAIRLGVSQAFVSAMVREERPISVRVLNKLGFRRTVVAK